jgi:hypothetical protein
MIQVEFWQVITLAIMVVTGFWAVLKVTAALFQRGIDTLFKQVNLRLDQLDNAAKADTGQWQRVERELLNLKADLPLHYVRREDYIRGQSILEAKLDGLGFKLENAQLRALKDID